jgi:hypothetical protein
VTDTLRIGLSSWIIQDGNYGDFAVGQRCPFALEFWPLEPLTVRHPEAALAPLSMTWERDAIYSIKGRVCFVAETWWAVDAGLPMYLDQRDPPGPVGTPVRGKIGVAIDHFSYFESLAQQPGAPALIFDWRVEAVEMDTAPFVETKPRFFERDRTRQGWKSLRHTNAWNDDGGHAEYILTCARLPGEARHHP